MQRIKVVCHSDSGWQDFIKRVTLLCKSSEIISCEVRSESVIVMHKGIPETVFFKYSPDTVQGLNCKFISFDDEEIYCE